MLNKFYRGCLLLVFFMALPILVVILILSRLAEEYVDFLQGQYDRVR